MSGGNNSKDSSIAKRIAYNLPRAGLLAIPLGSAIEKAIFGPLDDKAKDEARRELNDALDALRIDIRFAQADLKDQLAMLMEYIRAANSNLAGKIEHLNPVHIENFIVQTVKPTIINVFIKMDPEADKVSLTYRIYNKNLWDIKLAPWALTVMNLGGRAIIPQEPFQSWEKKLTPVRPLVLWGYTAMDDPRWIWGRKYIQLKQDRDAKIRQKIGLLNKQGWAAYNLGEDLFIKRYGFDPNASYADFGVNTEIYTDKDILEVETLGRYDNIEPGGCAEHKENWYIFKARPEEDEDSIDSVVMPLVKKTELP